MEKIKIFLIDRSEIFREGLAKLLDNKPDFEVLGACPMDSEAAETAVKLKPDVVILDTPRSEVSLSEIVSYINQAEPKTKVMILVRSARNCDLYAAIREGVTGAVSKDVSFEYLISVIRLVDSGGVVLDAAVAERLYKELISIECGRMEAAKRAEILTGREREVLDLVAQGSLNKEIANALFISEHTVKVHLHNILRKMHLRNRQEAAAYVMRDDLISLTAEETRSR